MKPVHYLPVDQEDIHHAHILIVDDELSGVKILEEVLMEEGFNNLFSTTDPFRVTDLCMENDFDLILLDILMPNLDGFGVLKRLCDAQNPTPILIITAVHEQETRLRGLKLGARDFITKPFDTEEMLVRIHNLLEGSLAQKRLSSHKNQLENAVQKRTVELRDRNQQLFETQREIMRRLARAAEYRDNETGHHVIRMSHYSRLLAMEIGLNEYKADLLLYTAPMHDVGKIGIPDGILLKPGKLNPDEWEVMKQHPVIGHKILSGHSSKLLQTASNIALSHHEKWDGSGYPKSLDGENIPLFGRIVAIADVFDALTSKRPYKPAWSIEQAIEMIKEEGGKHFDPRLTEAFKQVFPKILKTKLRYQDPTN